AIAATAGLFGIVGPLDKIAPAGACPAHLQDSVFLDLDEMRHIGGLSVETAGWQDLQLSVIECFTVACCEYARQDSDFAVIRMSMRREPEAFWELEAQRVGPRL